MKDSKIELKIQQLLEKKSLSKEDKIKKLESWKQDYVLLSTADSENMDGPKKISNELSIINNYLIKLKESKN